MSGRRAVNSDRYSCPCGEDRGASALANGKTSKNGKQSGGDVFFSGQVLFVSAVKLQTEKSGINEEALIVNYDVL